MAVDTDVTIPLVRLHMESSLLSPAVLGQYYGNADNLIARTDSFRCFVVF